MYAKKMKKCFNEEINKVKINVTRFGIQGKIMGFMNKILKSHLTEICKFEPLSRQETGSIQEISKKE